MNPRGRIALVTGGAVRIGRAIARALADAGAGVVIHYRGSHGAAREARDEIRARGGRAWTLRADLARDAAAEALVGRAARLAGAPVDILVNNAAVFHRDPLSRADGSALRSEFAVNLFAPLLLLRALAAQGRRGVAINLLDRRIEGLDVACGPYVLSKKALAEATRLAARAFAPRVRVNGVAPGAILPPPGRGPGYLKVRAGPVPLRRQCTPEDVAGAVLFLVRAEAVTGQIVFVDGGQHLLG